MLERRTLLGFDSRYPAIEAVGGMYVVTADTDRDELAAAIASGQVRAVEVQPDVRDLGFVADAPLEFLHVGATNADMTSVNTLRSLRSLALDSWRGALDVSVMPNLGWFAVTEIEPGQLQQLTGRGHPRLHHLSIGRYRESDLRPLAAFPRLEHLEIVDSRVLQGPDGVEQLRTLKKLDLAMCRSLATLESLAQAEAIVYVGLDSCNKIDDLCAVAALPALRAVKLDMREPPSVEPFLGHPAIEFVWLIGGRRPEDELTALLDNPEVRVVQSSRHLWMRGDGRWEHVENIYDMTVEQQALYGELHSARWQLMGW